MSAACSGYAFPQLGYANFLVVLLRLDSYAIAGKKIPDFSSGSNGRKDLISEIVRNPLFKLLRIGKEPLDVGYAFVHKLSIHIPLIFLIVCHVKE